MGIEHLYVAPPLDATPSCEGAPQDVQELGPEFAHPRLTPPAVALTLARLDGDGIAHATTTGSGTKRSVQGPVASVFVRDFTYGPQQLTIRRGATVRWHFADEVKHDVTVAAGPVGFASPWTRRGGRYAHTFEQPGTYLLQCSLHAAWMSQVVTVRREPPRRRAADPRPR
jgi:plastocyanin